MPAICSARSRLLATFWSGKNPALGAVPEHHAHLVVGPQRGQDALRAIAGHLVAVVEFHAVHDQHDRAIGQHLLAVQFHAHRQRGFQRRAAIAAGGVGLVAARRRPGPTPKSRTALSSSFSRSAPRSPGGDVADEDGVVALHLGQRGGEAGTDRPGGFEAGRTGAPRPGSGPAPDRPRR